MTLESAQQDPPGPNAADEPVRPTLSQQRAAGFLDATALLWHRHWGCINCHSNFAYLMARPALGVDNPAYRAVRATAEEMVNTTWPGEGPRWDPEVVMGAAVLGFGDAAAGRLQPVTRALVAAHHAGVPGIPENAATALRALRGLGLTLLLLLLLLLPLHLHGQLVQLVEHGDIRYELLAVPMHLTLQIRHPPGGLSRRPPAASGGLRRPPAASGGLRRPSAQVEQPRLRDLPR